MSNGKKFSAAEKFFIQKEERYTKKIKFLETENSALRQKLYDLMKEKSELSNVVEQQKEWIDRLLDFTNMSEEEIKKFCEHEKTSAAAVKSLSGLLGLFGNYSTIGGSMK